MKVCNLMFMYHCNLPINPFIPNELDSLALWTVSFSVAVSDQLLLSPSFIERPVFNANSVEPGQTSSSGSTLFVNVRFIRRLA